MTSAPAQTSGGGDSAQGGAPSFLPPPPQTFRARHGRRRVFLSQADADAYDDGCGMYPCEVPPETGPRSTGYFDMEDHHSAVR